MTDSIAEIAERLTKAQRRVLLTDTTGQWNTMQSLAQKGLYYFGAKQIKVNGSRVSYVIMPDGYTDDGLAVRAYLLESNP